MRKIISVIIICLFYSCNKKEAVFAPNFTDFIFVNLSLQENISLKFTGNDTLYFQKRLPDLPLENYIVVINKQDRDSLTLKINKLDLAKYESIYAQSAGDNSQVFILNKDGRSKSVCIIEGSGPEEMIRFGNWLNKLESKYKRIKTTEYIHFWNLQKVVPPPFPPSKLKKVRFIKSK
ncbi:hypothetical protein [uncultured Flavobacterium sp.]|uniref:hypothetical protein n=1 Tax=uncultured Flavobacterium sp. TaxID=165435 RepID=UPI0030817B0F